MLTEDKATADVLLKSVVVLIFVIGGTGTLFFVMFEVSSQQFSPLSPPSEGITGRAYPNISDSAARISAPVQSPLYITTLQSDIPSAQVGKAFSFEFSATGSVNPYTWSLEQPLGSGYTCTGRLPAGLILSDDGVLLGVPEAEETCLVAIKVSSQGATPARFDFAIRVS